MHPKCPGWLHDIREACDLILGARVDRSLADYERDRFLRSAVERSFEIIGEALRRIEKADPETASRIPDYRAIIGFRNVLSARGTVFEPLRDQTFFGQVSVVHGAVQWPNGADLAPDAMYDSIKRDGRWTVV